MDNIEQINAPRDYVIVRPVKFVFIKTSPEGFVAYDNEGGKVFYYPIEADYMKDPVKFLYECILKGGISFRKIMTKAYQEKKTVRIEQFEIEWAEYEALFNTFSCYKPKTTARIIEIGEQTNA